MANNHNQFNPQAISPKRLEAFENCIRENRRFFTNFALKVDRSHESAEDLVQDTLLDAWKGLGNFKEEASLKTWIMKIMANRIIDERRLRARRSVAADAPIEDFELEAPKQAEPEIRAEVDQQIGVLMDALATIDPKYREAILLRDIQGLSYREIVEQVGIPMSTVKGRIHDGREMIAEVIEKRAA